MELEKHYPEILRQAVAEIRTARNTIAKKVNMAAMGVYWNLGKLLSEKKIEKGHGAGVVNKLSFDLKTEFPDMGLSPRNLWNMKRYYERYYQAETKLLQAVAVLPVMLKSDFALLYGTETKFINKAVWIECLISY